MKRLSILVLIISIVGLVGCGKVATTNNISSQNAVVNKTTEIDSPTANITNNSSSATNSDTITDISSWNHPVKYVFNNVNIIVNKVDFKNNKTYPIFDVSFVKEFNDDNKTYYKNLIKQVATANGYWDYEIVDSSKAIDIKVTCDRSKNTVTGAVYNKNNNYFDGLNENNTESSDTELISYLKDNVSEVKSFVQTLENNKEGVRGIVYVERYPDPSSSNIYIKNYYGIYVGEAHSDHNVNTYRFAINKDTKEILYYDVTDDKYLSLDQWRKSK